MMQGPEVVVQDIPPVPDIPMPPMLPPWMVLPPEVIAMIALAFFAASAVVLYPLMRALARRIEGRAPGTDPALKGEVEELRARLGDMEGLQLRVADLEERLDFTERMLAQHRGAERLRSGEA